jgi:hypothetical protein
MEFQRFGNGLYTTHSTQYRPILRSPVAIAVAFSVAFSATFPATFAVAKLAAVSSHDYKRQARPRACPES